MQGMDDKIKDRIKKIRKDQNLSQEGFGKRISISKAAVSRLESGINSPSDQTINLICKEFLVNEQSLRFDTGPLYRELTGDDIYMRAATEISLNDDKYAMQAIIEYWKLKDENKKLIWEYLRRIIDNSRE